MIVALNNKCNLKQEEYKEYVEKLNNLETKSQLILCPTFLHIANTNLNRIDLGAQNTSATLEGAYTGEVSATQLKSFDVSYTIIGHSERREYQKESLEEIASKVNNLFSNDITPILCIGESKQEREENKVEEVLEKEISTAIENLTDEQKSKLIIAYEPIWSIGTGIIPTLAEIEEVFKFIKKYLPNSKILYGGSANEENVDLLKQLELIDGYLLGGLSLKPEKLQIFLNKLDN